MDNTMDNQQETVNIAWLSGAFDADGTVSIRDTVNRTPSPYMDWSNSDDSFIQKCVEIIQSLGINPYISEQKLNKKWKKIYRVRIHKQEQVKKLLTLMLPYLTAKKARSQILLNYLDNKDRHYVDDMKNANKRGDHTESSETICETPMGDDIVRTLAKSSGS